MSHLEVGSKYHSHLLPINVHLQNTQTGSSLIDRNFISFLFLFELEFSFCSPSKLSWCTVHLKDFYLITLLQFPAYKHTHMHVYIYRYICWNYPLPFSMSFHSFIKQVFIECLLCARHYSRCCSNKQNRQKSPPSWNLLYGEGDIQYTG